VYQKDLMAEFFPAMLASLIQADAGMDAQQIQTAKLIIKHAAAQI